MTWVQAFQSWAGVSDRAAEKNACLQREASIACPLLMIHFLPNQLGRAFATVGIAAWTAVATSAPAPMRIQVDATDATRNILHSRLTFLAQPGPLTLVYPKWLPGEHGPTGPVTDMVGLKVSADGKAIAWRRDAKDMFTFHVQVPANARTIEASLDFLLPPPGDGFSSSASSSEQLLVLSWNQVLLYQPGPKASEIPAEAEIRLPEGWKFATALPRGQDSGDVYKFAPVSLETLIDSPLIAGRHFRSVPLTAEGSVPVKLNVVADSAAALEIKPENFNQCSNLVTEAESLFGARHYRKYDFLLTLSDHVAHFGLEHHESSDNRQPEDYLTNPDALKLVALLLPHEMTHSWNGKYRRPLGLATPDYQTPMDSELLWVYEGLTDYLGNVLTARCGLWSEQSFREDLAANAAMLDHRKGRTWRPLADTTTGAQLLYQARKSGAAWRRSVDFYPEGDLIWLEVDTLIRTQTQGRRSVDDFCKAFYGGTNSPPTVVPYSYEDVLSGLGKIVEYDWRAFFQKRVYDVNPRAPLGGIEASGWRLVYKTELSDMLKAAEGIQKFTDLSYSLGLMVASEGAIIDVIPDSPAAKAGVAPDMKLVAVNGRRWTPALLRTAIQNAVKDSAPIELLVESLDFFKTCPVVYHGGERYPHLERDASKPDLLGDILRARNGARPAANP